MNNKYLFIVLFLTISCSYPDIDTVPNFGSLSISMQESIDLCKISNSDKENTEYCYTDLKNVINGLWLKNVILLLLG